MRYDFIDQVDKEIEIKKQLRNKILFRRFNLMREKFPFKGSFDLILCRNVMIYFDGASRQKVLDKFYQYLVPGGYLFIGHSESIDRKNSPFRYIKPAIYRKD